MAERTPRQHQHESSHEHEAIYEVPKTNEKGHESHQPDQEAKHHRQSAEKASQAAERHSKSKEDLESHINQAERREDHRHTPIDSSLKEHARQQGFRQMRRQLPKRYRLFSKTIHQPVIEAMSEVAEQTIARPSGLLSGGVFSLISSVSVLVIANYYGYEYNFFVGIAAFVIGFGVGLMIELAARLLRKG